jgi:hypothetical protein
LNHSGHLRAAKAGGLLAGHLSAEIPNRSVDRCPVSRFRFSILFTPAIDVLACPGCGGRLRLLATIASRYGLRPTRGDRLDTPSVPSGPRSGRIEGEDLAHVRRRAPECGAAGGSLWSAGHLGLPVEAPAPGRAWAWLSGSLPGFDGAPDPAQLASGRTELLALATPGVAVPRARRMLSARFAIPSRPSGPFTPRQRCLTSRLSTARIYGTSEVF